MEAIAFLILMALFVTVVTMVVSLWGMAIWSFCTGKPDEAMDHLGGALTMTMLAFPPAFLVLLAIGIVIGVVRILAATVGWLLKLIEL